MTGQVVGQAAADNPAPDDDDVILLAQTILKLILRYVNEVTLSGVRHGCKVVAIGATNPNI